MNFYIDWKKTKDQKLFPVAKCDNFISNFNLAGIAALIIDIKLLLVHSRGISIFKDKFCQ